MSTTVAPTGQRIGYVRVSSGEQNPARQLEGVPLDRVFTEAASAKDTGRPKLQELLGYARKGDVVVVHSMDRLARNVHDLLTLVKGMTAKGVAVEFRKENLSFTGNDSSVSHLMLTVLGAVAQFERDLIRERQREGIEAAKRRGVYRGRRKALTPEQAAALARRAEAGERKADLAREAGVSRETLYQHLRQARRSGSSGETGVASATKVENGEHERQT